MKTKINLIFILILQILVSCSNQNSNNEKSNLTISDKNKVIRMTLKNLYSMRNNHPAYEYNDVYYLIDSLIENSNKLNDIDKGLDIIEKSIKNRRVVLEKKIRKDEQEDYLENIEKVRTKGSDIEKLSLILEMTSLIYSRECKIYPPEMAILHGDTLELLANSTYKLPLQIINARGVHNKYKFKNNLEINTSNYTDKITKKTIEIEVEDDTGFKQKIEKEVYIKLITN